MNLSILARIQGLILEKRAYAYWSAYFKDLLGLYGLCGGYAPSFFPPPTGDVEPNAEFALWLELDRSFHAFQDLKERVKWAVDPSVQMEAYVGGYERLLRESSLEEDAVEEDEDVQDDVVPPVGVLVDPSGEFPVSEIHRLLCQMGGDGAWSGEARVLWAESVMHTQVGRWIAHLDEQIFRLALPGLTALAADVQDHHHGGDGEEAAYGERRNVQPFAQRFRALHSALLHEGTRMCSFVPKKEWQLLAGMDGNLHMSRESVSPPTPHDPT